MGITVRCERNMEPRQHVSPDYSIVPATFDFTFKCPYDPALDDFYRPYERAHRIRTLEKMKKKKGKKHKSRIEEIQKEREEKKRKKDKKKNKYSLASIPRIPEKVCNSVMSSAPPNIRYRRWVQMPAVPETGSTRTSVLSRVHHQIYLQLLLKYKEGVAATTEVEMDELKVFRDLEQFVTAEQKDFMLYVYEMGAKFSMIYQVLHPEVQEFVAELHKISLKALECYPQHYEKVDIVPLILRDAIGSVDIKHEMLLVKMGTMNRLSPPSFKSRFRIPYGSDRILDRLVRNTVEEATIHKLPVSKDPNAALLAEKYKADIVISSSAMKTLVNNHKPDFLTYWNVPCKVDYFTNKGAVRRQKVVYIDKPYPKKTMTAIEKNQQYYKYGIKFTLCSPTVRLRDECENVPDDDEDITKLETFGEFSVGSPCTSSHSSKPTQLPMKHYDTCQSTSGEVQLPCTPKKTKSMPEVDTIPPDDLLSKLLQDQSELLKHKKLGTEVKMELDTPAEPTGKFIPPGRNQNVSYDLWLLETKEKTLRVLVRSKCDASKKLKKSVKPYKLFPKLEYQPGYGAACSTIQEITHQWISLLLRPNCAGLRVRIDVQTSDVIMLQEVSISSLMKEAAKVGFKPSELLRTFYALSDALVNLPEGQYLISHQQKAGPFAFVFKSVEESNEKTIDARVQCQGDLKVTTPHSFQQVWCPIDTSIITPFNEFQNHIPATFPIRKPKVKSQKRKQGKLVDNVPNKKIKLDEEMKD